MFAVLPTLTLIIAFVVVSSQATAAPLFPDVMLSFDSLPAATDWPNSAPPAESVITDDFASVGIVFGRPGFSAGSLVYSEPFAIVPTAHSWPNGLVGLDANGAFVDPTADQYFSIVDPSSGTPATTSFLHFVIGDGGGDLDSWTIHVYDLWDTELEAREVLSSSHIAQIFRHPSLHRVWIEWTGPSGGYVLDDVLLVPEPGTLSLFVTLLGAYVIRTRIRQKRSGR